MWCDDAGSHPVVPFRTIEVNVSFLFLYNDSTPLTHTLALAGPYLWVGDYCVYAVSPTCRLCAPSLQCLWLWILYALCWSNVWIDKISTIYCAAHIQRYWLCLTEHKRGLFYVCVCFAPRRSFSLSSICIEDDLVWMDDVFTYFMPVFVLCCV